MRKSVALAIDRTNWTSPPGLIVPSTFPTTGITEVDFLGSLLQIGLLTVPWRGAECSLAVYWAHVRYCAAIQFGAISLILAPVIHFALLNAQDVGYSAGGWFS